MVRFERVAQRDVAVDLITVSSPDAFRVDVTILFEIVENPDDRTRRDSHDVCDVALAQFGVAADGDEDVRMVREKRPRGNVQLRIRQHVIHTVVNRSEVFRCGHAA